MYPQLIDLCLPALRKVLHLRAVTQCAVLESFSLFLVLSSKVSKSLVGPIFTGKILLEIDIINTHRPCWHTPWKLLYRL